MNLKEITKQIAKIGSDMLGEDYDFAAVSNSVISHSEEKLKEDFTATVYNLRWVGFSVSSDNPELLADLMREKIAAEIFDTVNP